MDAVICVLYEYCLSAVNSLRLPPWSSQEDPRPRRLDGSLLDVSGEDDRLRVCVLSTAKLSALYSPGLHGPSAESWFRSAVR